MIEEEPNNRWDEIVKIWRDRENQWLYAIVGFFVGLFLIPFLFSQINFVEGLGNLFPEALGILFTVAVIDRFNERRQIRDRKEELIVQMSSTDNGIARAAKREIRRKGWLSDGTLVGAELNDANLSNANLSDANLQKVNLSRANLQGATFKQTNLIDADLSTANLTGARVKSRNTDQFIKTLLSPHNGYHGDIEPEKAANLTGIQLPYGSNFKGKYLQKVVFRDADLEKVNFQDANLKGADFRNTRLVDANFENAWLEDAIFEGADLTNADFTGAHVGNANFKNSNLTDAKIQNIRLMYDIDTHPNIILEGAILPNGDEWYEEYDMLGEFDINDWDFSSTPSQDQCHFCGSYSVECINLDDDTDEFICHQCGERWYL